MTYIDVLIPALIGLLLTAAPSAFSKSTGDPEIDAPRQKKFRAIGLVLLAVAAIYLFSKMASQS